MKEYISEEQFMMRQPSYPEKSTTDEYYHHLCNLMMGAWKKHNLLPEWPEAVVVRAVLGLVGYFQDIIADSGLWRTFIEEHRRMYGKWLPFYETSEDYLPHELNPEDVRFLVWYSLSMNYEGRRFHDPESADIAKAADVWHAMLDTIYEEAPMPEKFFIWRGLEIGNPEEQDDVMHFSRWLFMHSYLLTPAYALTLSEIVKAHQGDSAEDIQALSRAVEESMTMDPTGPLALYLPEWLYLILDHKRVRKVEDNGPQGENPTYAKFIAATGGDSIKFIGSYDDLNDFFINSLGWAAGEKHLSQLEKCSDFVLLVNREKGMLLAHDIAKCIKMESNPYYDKGYAEKHAIELLTVRGCCPADLLHYLFENDALPDAHFLPNGSQQTTHENRDFIARCYLQTYYRGD